MPNLTLEQALALPQAQYQTVEQTGIAMADVISANMGSLIVTNHTSKFPIAHTSGLSCCICIAVENKVTGNVFVTHLASHWNEALKNIVQQARRSSNDHLEVHMIGGLYDYDSRPIGDIQTNRNYWNRMLAGVIETINTAPNTQLKTFDVGIKPHPFSIAFAHDANGKLLLIRGSEDITTTHEMVDAVNSIGPGSRTNGLFCNVEMTDGHYDLCQEEPYRIGYDGRLPANQDASRKRGIQSQPSKAAFLA